MPKVIILSQTFPAYIKGCNDDKRRTFFVEKFIASVHWPEFMWINYGRYPEWTTFTKSPKHHTIRAGHRWKAGDMASIRVWSGKPYRSPQTIIMPSIEIRTVYNFQIKGGKFYIKKPGLFKIKWKQLTLSEMHVIAQNDGLTSPLLLEWFKYPQDFDGQILCWGDVQY